MSVQISDHHQSCEKSTISCTCFLHPHPNQALFILPLLNNHPLWFSNVLRYNKHRSHFLACIINCIYSVLWYMILFILIYSFIGTPILCILTTRNIKYSYIVMFTYLYTSSQAICMVL